MDLTFLYGVIAAVSVLGILGFVAYTLKSRVRKEEKKAKIDKIEILEIQVPKLVEEGGAGGQGSAFAAEGMFASLHGLLNETPETQEHFTFEIAFSGDGGIKFYVTAPSSILNFVESQIYAQYPKAILRVVEDYCYNIPPMIESEVASLSLSKEVFFPIKSFRDFEVDPLSALTSSLADIHSDEKVWFQLLLRPVPDVWQKEGLNYVDAVKAGNDPNKGTGLFSGVGELLHSIFSEMKDLTYDVITGFFRPPVVNEKFYPKEEMRPSLSATQELELKTIENKLSKMGYQAQIHIVSMAADKDRVNKNLRALMASFSQFSDSISNSFRINIESDKDTALEDYAQRVFNEDEAFILSVEELATVFHLPSNDTGTPNISWLHSKKAEPPSTLPTDNCTYIGDTIFRSKQLRFGLKNGDDRLRHMYLIGKSGTGKSTLLETMITQDIANGEGVGVLDPHGETVEKILERIPDHRVDDVVLVDPSDVTRPCGINLLEMDDPSQKNIMASALVAAIKQHFDYSWGPRLEYLLNYALLTLLEVPGTTMLGVTRLLEDENYLKYILHQVKDPMVQKFWNYEFKAMKGNQKLVTEAIAPIQNKVNRFLASTTIRNILGQKNSTVDFWDIMNSRKIILMNLSKGKIGDDNANLLGALLVSRIQFTALQRAKIPYEDRTPFYLYVDEFQNFATGSFETILSESRKYKLGLYLTHQYTAQLPEEVLKAVFGNVGTIATFALGAPDARALSSEFAPFFDETDIISLERFHIYIKMMIDGMTSLPFSARILLPWDPNTSVVARTPNKQKVIELSRMKHGVDATYVEDKISKWLETRFDKGTAIAMEQQALKSLKQV